jgi:protein phosphatase 1 regulatory subunit 21
MFVNRIKDLELQVSKQMNNHNEIEKKLRKEIEVLTAHNTELETRIIEATSQLGSEGDSTSLASDSTIPISNIISSSTANTTNHTDDRIAFLEKELNHYRTQYELLKINDALRMDENLMTAAQSNQLQHSSNNNNNNNQTRKVLSSQSSTSSSLSNNNNNSTFVNYPTSSQSSGSKSSPCQNSKR